MPHMCECQAVARWEADNKDVLPEQLSADLARNVNAAMQLLNAELRHKNPERQQSAKALFAQLLNANLRPKLPKQIKTMVEELSAPVQET